LVFLSSCRRLSECNTEREANCPATFTFLKCERPSIKYDTSDTALLNRRFILQSPFVFFPAWKRYTGCPTRYRTWYFFNNSNTNEDIATKQTHTTDTFFFISHTTNVLLFKFRCNIFICVRIIKEMPGSVANGIPCTNK